MPAIPLASGGLGFGQTFATSTYGTTITAGGSANTEGTVVELIAATPHDAHWVEVMAGNPSVASHQYLFDILIGAATEAELIPNLGFRARNTNEGGARWLFPVFVPKGSRIAARLQCTSASATILVAVNLFNAGIAADGMATAVDQYGTITASAGLNVDPGAVAHTDSAWVQITAATLRPHTWLVLTVLNEDSAWAGLAKWLVDVGIGAATETVILSDWPIGGATGSDLPTPGQVIHIPVFVPQGSRLTVRARCSSTTDGDRDLYATIHCAG